MTQLSQIGILPALLIALGGLLVLRSAESEKAQQRFLRYLLLVGSLLLLALLVSIQMTPLQDNRPFWQVSTVMMPAIIAVLALILLHARQIKTASRAIQLWALLLLLGLAGLIAYWRFPLDLAYSILPGVAVLVLGWQVGRRFRRTAVLLAILLFLALIGLNLMQTMPASDLPPLPRWAQFIVAPVIFGAPSLLVVIAAGLITNGLQHGGGKRPFLLITLAVALVGTLAYSTYWSSVWDQTSDGLGGLFLSHSSSVVAVGAGIVMAVKLTGWQRAAGLLFAIVTPLLLLLFFEWGWQVSYHDLTEARAERITQALASYHQREGAYPPALEALTPRDLLYLHQPVEIQGETWCYQGGAHFYRLGAFYREYFSLPVQLKVFAAQGEPDSEWACAGQLAEMKERYDFSMENSAASQSASPTPLPPSEVAEDGRTPGAAVGRKQHGLGQLVAGQRLFLAGTGR
jgi:hypothetical protein